jgi:hypothetical protein
MPWGSDGVGFWARELTTLSELLVQAGNQRAARLLSLVQDTDEADPVVGEQVRNVVLRVRPIFLDLFRPADLDAVADQMDKLVLPARHHKVTVAAGCVFSTGVNIS